MNTRENNYDLLRVLCSFMVVLIHVNVYYLEKNLYIGSTEYIIEVFLNYISRFSVPCFLMLSGAFLLHNTKNENAKMFYANAFYKLGIPYLMMFFLWAIIYAIKVLEGNGYGYKAYIFNLIKGTYGNLWFMPMLIGIYLLTPYIIKIKYSCVGGGISLKIGIIYLGWAMVSVITTNDKLPYSIATVVSFLSYYLMGDILYNLNYLKKKASIFLGLIIVVITVITVFYRSLGNQFFSVDYSKAFFSPSVVVLSISVFLIFKGLKVKKSLKSLANLTYYIYLIHALFLECVRGIVDVWRCNELLKIIISSLLIFAISGIVSSIWIWIRRKINEKFCLQEKIKCFVNNL